MSYRVENLELLIYEVRNEGIVYKDEIERFDYGKYIHLLDLEGNKIELWEPNEIALDKIAVGRTK